jgi:DNA recombination protein RmuC
MSATVLIVALVALVVGAVLGLLVGRAGGGASEDRFRRLANDALTANNEQFLQVAEQRLGQFQQGAAADLATKEQAVKAMVDPVSQKLGELDQKLAQMDRERTAVTTTLDNLQQTAADLAGHTTRLSTALRDVRTRGSWGEVQLRRVVELAGMVEHCDFSEQKSFNGDDGRSRPDMVVHLPAGRTVVVDSKVPLDAFMDATEMDDPEQRAARMKDHAKALDHHVVALAGRRYDDVVDGSIDLVVMFVPGEAFLVEAFEADPSLFERAITKGVFLSSPATLVALLKSVAYGWRESRLTENSEEIARLGAELHNRVGTMADHLARLGRGIATTTKAFNDAVGSFEGSVTVTTRKFEELGAKSGREVKALEPLTDAVREVKATAPTLVLPSGTDPAGGEPADDALVLGQ